MPPPPKLFPARQLSPARVGLAALRLAALLALVPLSGCNSNQVEIDPEKQLELYMTTATYLYQDDSLVRAQDQAVKALEIDPENKPMRRMLGWIRLRMGTPADLLIAEQIFQELYDEGDEEIAVLLGLASVEERLGLAYSEASREIASGERAPEKGDPEERAAELTKTSRERWERSKKNYERVLSGPTQTTKALNGLLRVTAHLGEYDEALNWASQLLEVTAKEAAGWETTLRSQELSETEERVARESLRSATDVQLETHLVCTTILHRLGRTKDALAHLGQAIAIDPARPELYSRRAQLSSEMGQFSEAIADLDKFLRISEEPFEHPDVRRAYELRIDCERKLAEAAARPAQ